jgi:hypothetical protein
MRNYGIALLGVFILFGCASGPKSSQRSIASNDLKSCDEILAALNIKQNLRSWQAISNTREQGTIEQKEFSGWSWEQWEQSFGKILAFKFDTFDFQGAETVIQQPLGLADFSFSQQKLIRLLDQLKGFKKYRQKSAGDTFHESYSKRKDIIEYARSKGIKTDLTLDDAKQAALEDAGVELKKDVEVGYFNIILADGRTKTALFGSSKNRYLDADHIRKALFTQLIGSGIKWTDIVAIQFFHVHPAFPAPLSASDVNNAKAFKDIFAQNGASIESHVYAISSDNLHTIIFHYGFGP